MALRCRLGGWLHDIGKLAIADRVLQAPAGSGRRVRFCARTSSSAPTSSAVSQRSAVPPAPSATTTSATTAPAIPTGSPATTIPIDARIVAAADAWSAIRHGRPYQAALEPAQALEQLRASAGTSLDPAVSPALAVVVTAQPELASGRQVVRLGWSVVQKLRDRDRVIALPRDLVQDLR